MIKSMMSDHSSHWFRSVELKDLINIITHYEIKNSWHYERIHQVDIDDIIMYWLEIRRLLCPLKGGQSEVL